MNAFQFAQIGVIRSPYKEKFTVPRQPGLMKHGGGKPHLVAPYSQADAVRDLRDLSHLWILFMFHQIMGGGQRPTMRPPQLGGNMRMDVFATCSAFRPNPIGTLLVELKGIRCQRDQVTLELSSLDLVGGTPVVDIKPCLPFAETLPDTNASYAQQVSLAGMDVSFTPETGAQLLTLKKRYPHIKAFIREVLAQNPRPAYRKEKEAGKNYAVWLLDSNVRWRAIASGFEVFALEARQFYFSSLLTSLPHW